MRVCEISGLLEREKADGDGDVMIMTDQTTPGPGLDTPLTLSIWAPEELQIILGTKLMEQSVIHLAEHSYPHMLLSDRDINHIFMAQF